MGGPANAFSSQNVKSWLLAQMYQHHNGMHKVTARRWWTNPLRTTNSEKLFGYWNDFWWNRGVYIQEATQTCGVQKVNNIWWLQRTTSEVTAGGAKLNFSKCCDQSKWLLLWLKDTIHWHDRMVNTLEGYIGNQSLESPLPASHQQLLHAYSLPMWTPLMFARSQFGSYSTWGFVLVTLSCF